MVASRSRGGAWQCGKRGVCDFGCMERDRERERETDRETERDRETEGRESHDDNKQTNKQTKQKTHTHTPKSEGILIACDAMRDMSGCL